MRKSVVHLIVVALTSLVPGISGCAADPGIPEELRPVHGIWRWDHSVGGIADVRMDPDTEGRDLVFHFRRDGTLHIYSAGTHLASPGLEVAGAESMNGLPTVVLEYSEPFPFFSFDLGITSHRAVRAAPDTLVLWDPCCGRYRHTLVRVS